MIDSSRYGRCHSGDLSDVPTRLDVICAGRILLLGDLAGSVWAGRRSLFRRSHSGLDWASVITHERAGCVDIADWK